MFVRNLKPGFEQNKRRVYKGGEKSIHFKAAIWELIFLVSQFMVIFVI